MKTNRRTRREARRLYRTCLLGGLLDEGRARQVVGRVAGAKRRGSLGVLTHLHRLVRLDQDRHHAIVESATSLPADLVASVKEGVARVYGAGMSATFVQNPALIGGVRIRVGSDVYDGSVRAALARLEERF
jgi:F-type H+-transporting ATPase subunit delta